MFGQLLGKAQVGQLIGLGLREQFLKMAGGGIFRRYPPDA
jgi:hypothetical protein